MRILACYKLVPEEQDIEVRADSTLDFSNASWKVGEYDLTAIEMAMRLGESAGDSEVMLLTLGGSIVSDQKLKKGVYARGPKGGFAVMREDDGVELSSYEIARILTAAIKKIDNVDLVMCGEGSGDVYSQQVAPMLGAMLGWPVVNAANEVTVCDDGIQVKRDLEDAVEIVQIPLPAVVSATSEACKPRVAGMKDILSAGKKEQVIWGLSELDVELSSSTKIVSTLAPQKRDRSCQIFEGLDSLDSFVESLRKAM